MNNIISATLDVVDYIVNDDLEKLANVVENLSEDAKKAYIPTMEEVEQMDGKQFAVRLWHPTIGTFNKFAMTDAGITEININLLASALPELPEELIKIAATNLTCAAKKFKINIPECLEKYASKKYIKNILDIRTIDEASMFEKNANKKKTKFAMPDAEKYPINTKEEIIKAAEYFTRNNNIMTMSDKKTYYNNLINSANESGVDLSKYASLEKYKILDTNVINDELGLHINSRISFLKEAQTEYRNLYKDLIKKSKDIGVEKTASVLEVLDNKTGLSAMYGKGLEDPIIACTGLKKEAYVSLDGEKVTMGMLRGISNEDLTSVIGNTAIKDLKGENGLNVFASFPKPVRREVLALIK